MANLFISHSWFVWSSLSKTDTDGVRKEVIEDIITRLLPADDKISKELLALTQLFASLAFKKNDEANQAWLLRRFTMLQDIFIDSPEVLHDLSVKIAQAQTMEEVQNYLAMWDETNE